MRGKRDLLSSTEIFEAKTDNKQANKKQNERKSMNNKFDELAKGLAQSVTRQQALTKFGALILLLALPGLVPAQALVPLIPPEALQDADGGDTGALVKLYAQGLGPLPPGRNSTNVAAVVFADPSQITYPTVQPGVTIAGPAGPDAQVNDPSLDNIQSYSPYFGWNPFPWEFATESETTVAAAGNNIVVSYNSSARNQLAQFNGKNWFLNLKFSGYSVSHDGGRTWRSDAIPVPGPGANSWTTGDGVVATDRAGNFYYASLGSVVSLPNPGVDAEHNWVHNGVLLAVSTNHGDTFGTPQFIAMDDRSDKDWLAVGPDPAVPSRDNIYVTWTSYYNGGNALVFSRSTDGGATWSAVKTLFAPADDGVQSSYTQESTPVVDKSTGRLYIAFLHYGDLNPDYIRVLVSDDGGNTFYPLAFNVPGAPNPFVYPKVAAGILADCGKGGGTRVVVKQGPDIGGGLWTELYGIPRYVHCSRIPGVPAVAAQNGRLVIALDASTSPIYGDPTSQSQIIALYSSNGGESWNPPVTIAPATANDPQHVIPAVALTQDAKTLYVGYYVQHSDEKIRTELATLKVANSGLQLQGYKPLSSVSFDLEPNNIPSPFPPLKSEDAVNFDQVISSGYALGEYMGLTTDANGNPMAAWGDCRNTWVSPANGLYPGAHPKPDVFFVRP
jgi:hypothetical protein